MLLNWSSYQTVWDTRRLIQLYHLSFWAGQVPCDALCTIDFYFSPLLSLSSYRSLSHHLSTSNSLFQALKRPAGQTDAGLDQSGKVIWDASCTQAHTHTHTETRQMLIVTHTHLCKHTPLLCCTPACLPPVSSICIYFIKWILLFFSPPPPIFSLCDLE